MHETQNQIIIYFGLEVFDLAPVSKKVALPNLKFDLNREVTGK